MITRARPKYLPVDMRSTVADKTKFFADDGFYFNSGRAALKFYLAYLSEHLNKKLSVAIQAFNCHVVAQAALEAGCKLYLVDITLEDFSMSFDEFKKIYKQIDIVILTHYQGIPNQHYKAMAEFCRENNIILIEDLAQTYKSSIDGIEVGALGDAVITSYAFDKPFTCLYGGQLILNRNSEVGKIKQKYNELHRESSRISSLHLRTLAFLYAYTNQQYYRSGMTSAVFFFSCLTWMKLPKKMIYRLGLLLNSLYIFKVFSKLNSLFTKHKLINIKKMGHSKISFIKAQEQKFLYDIETSQAMELLSQQYGVTPVSIPHATIHWNRYSVLDKLGEFKSALREKGLEVGNFNWSVTLDQLYREHPDVICLNNFDNAWHASKFILNIPVWSKFE